MNRKSKILIRAAEEKDLPSIHILLSELGYDSVDADLLKETWKQIISSKKMGIVVAEIESKIAGYLAYSFKPQLRLCGLSMEIDELSISEIFRGSGIGTSLINEAKNIAKSNQAKRIILSTNRDRESYKRSFYTKNGFQEKNSAWFNMDL